MARDKLTIPVIDLFAGPGGLGEGFASSSDRSGRARFRLALSIEKDRDAHKTLELRSFFRQFDGRKVPEEYYEYLRGTLSREELFNLYLKHAEGARQQAWCAELGGEEFSPKVVDHRIRQALGNNRKWVLIGGPPCQAYSTVGRVRMRSTDPAAFERDPRHFLYKEYLRILAVHRPPVFVMENVKGLLTAKVNGERIFEHILEDLQEPRRSGKRWSKRKQVHGRNTRYRILPISKGSDLQFVTTNLLDYVVESERYGIPQARHRVILLGIRDDLASTPCDLTASDKAISTWKVIGDLPKIRSGLTREKDSSRRWAQAVRAVLDTRWFKNQETDPFLWKEILSTCSRLSDSLSMGGEFMSSLRKPKYRPDWFSDERLGGVCNHSARTHMREDLHRYLFSSCYARVYDNSPLLKDFPKKLLPKHRNVGNALGNNKLFSDRFRVQLRNCPSTTVTSHISNDGHNFIHPDPVQCRSLTVREAARLQTFPDNYFFEGSRTSQYKQVGNAVPPLLAAEVAEIVWKILK